MSEYLVHWGAGIISVIALIILDYFMAWGLFQELTCTTLATLFFVGLFFSVIADIDSPASVIRTFVFGFLFLTIGYFAYVEQYTWIIIMSIIAIGIMILRHRGITHSLALSAVLPLPLLLFGPGYYLSGVVAYNSHLILDGEIKLI